MKKLSYSIIILFALIFSIFACNKTSKNSLTTQQAANTIDSIRTALGIPDSANRVVILSHAAHMDWDWLNPFQYNVNKTLPGYNTSYFGSLTNPPHGEPADSILSLATQNLLADTSYYYSVCEMGFLRAFANDHPSLFDSMKNSQRLRIVGGGITSPDNLLPNGEAFFRNFLVAKQWLDAVNVPWSQQVWLPDDFGHDPQLPVMLQALDAMGVGFARIPGASDGNPQEFKTPAQSLLDTNTGGVDFFWMGADSSKVIAHWMQDHYSQGQEIDNGVCNPIPALQNIGSYIDSNSPVSPTPYIYVQVSDDFMTPYQQLVCDANEWNTSDNPVNSYKATGVYAVVATFDHYTRLVNCYQQELKTRSYNPNAPNGSNMFQPNPYWMGYYASRPELKTKHNEAARSLLGAEIFQVISNTLTHTANAQKQSQINELLSVWDSLSPSTHHDYITGTAVDSVYGNEQINMLDTALALGTNLKYQFINDIVAQLPEDPNSSSIAVFNQLGFNNQGIIEYQSENGETMYLNVTAPSLGYQVNDLTMAQQGNDSLGYAIGSDNVTFYNSQMSAVFDTSSGDLLNVTDLKNQILNGVGNEIVIFNDGGGIYRFGYELDNCTFSRANVTWTTSKVTLNIANALQKSITVEKIATFGDNNTSFPFTITYSLRQGEPYLRISTKGSLPNGYTAMVKFPLVGSVNNLIAGTPYHWNTMTPSTYGAYTGFNATMWATHDFVMPQAVNGNILAAIYHGSTPAWTTWGDTLFGVILRNTSGFCANYGATGHDFDAHTQEYALRIPTGLQAPDTGQPFMEARQYNTPMVAVAVPASGSGNLETSYSLASTTSNSYITTAKWSYTDPNSLIFRVYQPSNNRMASTLNLSQDISNCSAVSALEIPIENANVSPDCSGSDSQYQLKLPRAVATFKLELQND